MKEILDAIESSEYSVEAIIILGSEQNADVDGDGVEETDAVGGGTEKGGGGGGG